jgi:hypothetical protein
VVLTETFTLEHLAERARVSVERIDLPPAEELHHVEREASLSVLAVLRIDVAAIDFWTGEISLEFGINISAAAGAIIAEAGDEAPSS